jgi:uncharacterized repeat protein (TIGR01451 family)
MILTGSSIPPSSIQYPFVEFNLGRLDIYQKGQMEITVNIDCNSTITGQTHCVTAQMLPHRDCIQSALWSGASIKLETSCNTGKVKFRIENAGKADMADPVKYWIVEDDIMPGLKKDVKLNKGQYLDLEYTTNGKSYRILTDQVDNHPGHSNPTVAFEGCGRDGGGDFSKGYLLMFPEDEEDPDIAIDCQASRASYDPNDKSAMPLGYGIDKLIEPGRSIEYKIRFQNIGNDTAFKVIVIDTLDQWLDPASIKVLGASHEFSFSLVDRILTFRFDPIYLPYRAIDDAASNGYIIYSIKPKIEAPLNSIITNTAEVYFDFNPAIITNTTLHKLATDFIIVAVSPTDPDNTNVNIYPNPGTDFLTIHSESMSMEKEVGIYDAFGQLIISQKLYGKKCKINLEKKLHSGVYIIRVKDLHNKIYSGKIIVEH